MARFEAGTRKKGIGKGMRVAPSARTGKGRGEIAKMKETMEMMMGKFGRLAKGMMLVKDVDTVGERVTMAGILHCQGGGW